MAMIRSRRRAPAVAIAALTAVTAAVADPVGADEAAVAADSANRDVPGAATTSIWAGIFTQAQASRGEAVYTGPCSQCHGYRLDGAPDDPDMLSTPPVAGAKFLRDWAGRSLAALLEYSRETMPANNPGYLSAGEYADIIAYMLLVSGAPAGDADLASDQRELGRIVIAPPP